MALNISISATLSPAGAWQVTTNNPFVVLTLTNGESFAVVGQNLQAFLQTWPSRNDNLLVFGGHASDSQFLVEVPAGQSVAIAVAVPVEQLPAPAASASFQATIHFSLSFTSDFYGANVTSKTVDVGVTVQRGSV